MFKKLIFATILASVMSLPSGVFADEMKVAVQALDDALPGKLIHNPFEMEWQENGRNLKSKVVDAQALASGKAIQAKQKKRENKPWDAIVRTPISGDVKSGDHIQIYYWIRTEKAPKGAESADVTLFLGRNEEPYDNILSIDIRPGTEWELKSADAIAKSNFPIGELKAEYQLGRATQTVEIGPVYVSKIN